MTTITISTPAPSPAVPAAPTPQASQRRPAEGAGNGRKKPDFRVLPLPEDLKAANVFVNIEGDYSYLTNGYYLSMEAEHEGLIALPSPQDSLDAYVVPIALAKAQAAGIPIPEWEIVNDTAVSIPVPMIAYPINPFQDEGVVVTQLPQLNEAIKSLTMTNKYAVVVQAMPPDSRVDTLRLVLGRCTKPEYRELALKLWQTFRLPLARVKVIVTEKQYLFSAIEPLSKDELTLNEVAMVKEAGLWRA